MLILSINNVIGTVKAGENPALSRNGYSPILYQYSSIIRLASGYLDEMSGFDAGCFLL